MPKHHRTRHIPFGASNFLSVLEGIEGGFAIFAGIIAGLSFENISRDLLIMTAVISLVVNAFNCSTVRFSSEHYLDELDGREKRSWVHAYLLPASVEFLTYLIVSVIAVLPLVFIADQMTAVWSSVVLTEVILFLVGCYRGRLLGLHAVRDGFELAGIGMLIIGFGAAAGWLLSLFLV